VPAGADSLAGRLGEELLDQVFDCVYTDCLSHIVQSSDTSWPTVDKISQLAERFQTNISRHLQLQVSNYSIDYEIDIGVARGWSDRSCLCVCVCPTDVICIKGVD